MLSLFFTLLCSCLWAGILLATKLLSGTVSASLYTLIRYTLVTAILAPFLVMSGQYKLMNVRDLPACILLGFWVALVYTLLFFAGVHHASVTSVAILSATSPVCMDLSA